MFLEASLISAGVVALSEMGDKTQLLALVLAVRFRRPWPIVLGILVATLVNHALAGAVGSWASAHLGEDLMRRLVALSFILLAAWILIPDKLDDDGAAQRNARFGVFGSTVIAFFLAEMGDKTQIATVVLAARFDSWFAVVLGSTAGMMLANAPVVWLGERITRRIPLALVRKLAALLFLVLGLIAFWPDVARMLA